MEAFMNFGYNWLVAVVMALALSACATGASSPADSTAGQSSSKPVVSAEPECD
jgi:hypothetical protein